MKINIKATNLVLTSAIEKAIENNVNKSFCAGIHILVQKGSKSLLLKKSADDKNDSNCWDLPGGGIEFGRGHIKDEAQADEFFKQLNEIKQK